MSTYFVRRDSRVTGPFSAASLKQLANTGGLRTTDQVSRDQESWTPATGVKGLEFGPPPFDPEVAVAELPPPPALGAEPPPPARGPNVEGCPDCSGLVSLRATDYPHCGCPIRRSPAPPIANKFGALRHWLSSTDCSESWE